MKKYILLLAILPILGCQEDEVDTQLAPEEVTVAIQQATQQMVEDMTALMQSEGMKHLEYAMGFMAPPMDEQPIESLLRMLGEQTEEPGEGMMPFDFEPGLFEWDPTINDFVEDESYEGDAFILKYPSEGSEVNDAVFTVTTADFTEEGLPVKVLLNLVVAGEEMVNLSIDVNWSFMDVPQTAEVLLFLNPYNISLSFNLANGTNTTLVATLSDAEGPFAALDLSSPSVLMSALTGAIPRVQGYFEYRNVKIEGSADLQAILQEEEAVDPNEHIEAKVFIDGQKAGDLVFIAEQEGEETYYVPYVELTDGTLLELGNLFGQLVDLLPNTEVEEVL